MTRTVRRIIWHHTAGTTLAGALQTLEARGLHYHRLIEANGNIHVMRDFNLVAFHAGAANADSIGIALIGNFQNGRPTQAQLDSAAILAHEIQLEFGELSFQNHRDVSATLCPVVDLAGVVRKHILTKFPQQEPLDYPQDVFTPSAWSEKALAWVAETGISDGTRLGDFATREEMLTIVHRLYEMVAKDLLNREFGKPEVLDGQIPLATETGKDDADKNSKTKK